MSADLEDQLAAYGTWLEDRSGADLIRHDVDVRDDDRTTTTNSGREPSLDRRTIWLQVAAALLVVAGIGGLVLTQRESDPAAPAAIPYSSSTDPEAHLFVLPATMDDLRFVNGSGDTVRPEPGEIPEGAGVVVGLETDDGFADLVQIHVSNTAPVDLGIGESTEVDAPDGTATVVTDNRLFAQVTQRRGESWIALSGNTETQALLDVLSQTTLEPDGSISVEDGQGRTVIGEYRFDMADVDYSTYYEATDTATGVDFVVETASWPSALVGAFASDTAAQVFVNGTPAWLMTRADTGDGDVQVAIVWRATPNRVVALSAHTSPDIVEAMAQRIVTVTEEEWFAAIPGASLGD